MVIIRLTKVAGFQQNEHTSGRSAEIYAFPLLNNFPRGIDLLLKNEEAS
jgi:hypothetical protein